MKISNLGKMIQMVLFLIAFYPFNNKKELFGKLITNNNITGAYTLNSHACKMTL